jgi:tRNA (guanine37-N1)-methyltransferase
VPQVLLSGHHGAIVRWRREQALRRTAERRPDLVVRLDPGALEPADRALLAELGWQEKDGRFSPVAPPVAD